MDEEHIFLQAAAITSPDERATFLDEACGDDEKLRWGVETLLRHHQEAGSFLEEPPAALVATIATGTFDTVDDGAGEIALEFLQPCDKPGCLGRLGSYEVVDAVGRGGMGLVLRAYDTKLNRVVAIKALAPELAANAMAAKRFLREARAAAAVSHDHVVTIHAIESDSRPPFLVMEFVDGASLQQKIDRQGALELAEILRIGIQVARGLSAAHEQGLVHRDIKPANILLENGVERVKLTDFGLARAVDDVSVTQTGQIAGTPQFMSPEQAQGLTVDARSDLFSLGSVLYTMCTGRPPFRADTAVAMLRRVTDDAPRSIRELNAELPGWLEAIIFKLLAKNPDERFHSAEEVADLLSRHLAHVQNPEAAPRPPETKLESQLPSFDLDEEFSFIETTQRIYAWIALMWAIVATVFAVIVYSIPGNFNATLFQLNAPWALATGLISAITSWLAFVGTRNVRRRDSYRKALLGNLAALLPVNPPLLLAVGWSIASLFKLRHPQVRSAFAECGVAKEPTGQPTEQQSRSRPKLEVVLAGGGCLALLFIAGTMMYVKTNHGTIAIEIHDPETEVSVPGHPNLNGITIHNASDTMELGVGQYSLHIKHGGLEFETEQFRIKRGEQVVVSVERINDKLAARLGSNVIGAAQIPQPEGSGSTSGYELEFDGRQSYVETPIRLDRSHPLTFEAFVTPRVVTGENQMIMGDTQQSGVALMLRDDGLWRFGVWDETQDDYVRVASEQPAVSDLRVHLAGVFDGNQMRLYVDGRLQYEAVNVGQMAPSRLPIMIGANWEPGNRFWEHFAGSIDEVRVSKTARYRENFTPAERLRPDKQTLGLYHFDEGSGKAARDSSGNEQHAVIVNAEWKSVAANRDAAELRQIGGSYHTVDAVGGDLAIGDGNDRSQPQFWQLPQDSGPQAERQETLIPVRTEPHPEVEELWEEFSTAERSRREEIVSRLVSLGREEGAGRLATLRVVLKIAATGEDNGVVDEAFHAVEEIGEEGDLAAGIAVQELVAYLNDNTNPLKRRVLATRAIGSIGEQRPHVDAVKSSMATLLRALDSEEDDLVAAALWSLGQIGESSAALVAPALSAISRLAETHELKSIQNSASNVLRVLEADGRTEPD